MLAPCSPCLVLADPHTRHQAGCVHDCINKQRQTRHKIGYLLGLPHFVADCELSPHHLPCLGLSFRMLCCTTGTGQGGIAVVLFSNERLSTQPFHSMKHMAPTPLFFHIVALESQA